MIIIRGYIALGINKYPAGYSADNTAYAANNGYRYNKTGTSCAGNINLDINKR